MSVEFRPMQEEDRDRIVSLHLQAFNLPSGDLDRLYAIPLEDVRVVTEDGLPVASLRLLRVGHFCGRRSVPAADVTAVQVAPECRSKGYGGLLMREVLKELRAEGTPLSTLYPSTPAPYRRSGYEMAGVYTRYSVPVAALPRHRYQNVETWEDSSLDEIVDCYQSRARAFEGLLDRPRSWWPERILRVAPPENRPVYRYLVRCQGRVTGYMVFTQERVDSPIPYFYSLGCRDLVWHDAETARTMLGFAASHRALATNLTWSGPVEDPVTFFLDEQDASAQWSMLWMARLIHVRKALEARGYPPGLEAAVEFRVEDALLPTNSRAYRMEVSGGQARVESIDVARMKVGVGGLAAMYTSWLPARDAVRCGHLIDAGKQEVETLEAIFAGAKPWLADQSTHQEMTPMYEPADGALSWGSRISQLAEQQPDKIAMILAPRAGEDRPVTWTHLDVTSNRAAHLLKNRGVAEHSVVVIGLPNGFEHVLAVLGVWKLGGCVLPVNARLPARERDQILEIVEPGVVVADWTDLKEGVVSSRELNSLDDFSNEPLPDRISHPAKAIASGGSTGRSKVIVDPSPGARAPGEIAKLAAHFTGFRSGQVQLVAGPLYHHAPFCWTFWGLFEDQTVVLLERFDAARAVDLIEQYGVNFSCLVPTMMRRMIRLSDIQERDLSSLEGLYHTGGPCPVWLKEAWIDLIGPEKIYEAYGSTEEIGFTAIRGDEWLEHRGSVGRPGNNELKILGADGQELALGEVGEVFMRRNDVTGPTYKYMGSVPAKTTPDGFASVGDLGWLDEDGYLFLADRRVDMIVSGGANVYPAEVEGALAEHPDVDDVAVVGVPDEEWGRRVHAIIEPADFGNPPPPVGLDEHCRQRLAAYKAPKSYEFLRALPRNQAGKIRRSALVAERQQGRTEDMPPSNL